MAAQWISIAVLLLLFVVATLRPVNLGVLGLVAALGVGLFVARLSVDDVYAGFPADVFVLLLGVTYLFAIATVNGTIARIVDGAARLLRGIESARDGLAARMFDRLRDRGPETGRVAAVQPDLLRDARGDRRRRHREHGL